ncbi:hypothetical protein [Anaerotignum sp.]|uniref:hypothetical protein n=1 Tax=Anaerotignum sp. TaxID=2039241 RepID=UPI0039A1E2F8
MERWTTCGAEKGPCRAAELGAGLLEATEVVEPNPIHPNESTSYSNLYHCDRDGCIFTWTPSADRWKMPSGKVRNRHKQLGGGCDGAKAPC